MASLEGEPMIDHDIADVRPAFSAYLRRFSGSLSQKCIAKHFDNTGRGWLSHRPRKSVGPIALACGTAARTLLPRQVADVFSYMLSDILGAIGILDEASGLKKGTQTPGVQRQYLGCVGKVDNGIVTVHMGVAGGTYQALLDAELDLPVSWHRGRERCRQTGIPDTVIYQSQWRMA